MPNELHDAAGNLRSIKAALRESEQRGRQLFEVSPDAIFVEDENGTVLDVNAMGCQLHGMSRDELVGKNVADLVPERFREEVRRAFPKWITGEMERFEGVSLRGDGREIPVEISGRRIQYAGRPAILLHVRDITVRRRAMDELRQAKEFAENLIRTANVLIVGLDGDGRVEMINETAEQALGYAEAEIIGRNWFDVVVPKETHPEAWEAFRRIRDTGEDGIVETRLRTKSGTERIVSWRNNRVMDNGRVGSIVVFGIDMTGRREEESRRLALEKKMLAAQKLESLGLLAGGIAHDFNNLLTAIVGNCSLLRMETEPASPTNVYLTEIDSIASQAADLCKQLLAYAGQRTLEKQPTDLNQVINETRQLLQVSVDKKVRLSFYLLPDLPAIQADPTQLRQVLLNLAINASDAIGSADGTIRFATKVRKVDRAYTPANASVDEIRPGLYIVLEVTDSGCGMSEEVRSRIFDPFFTTKQSGRGLGLAAVMGIVRGHGGIVEVESREREGTTFRILLPVAGEQAVPVLRDDAEAPQTEWHGAGSALVVDDEASVLLLGGRMLKAMGFEVVTAADGLEGVTRFKEREDGFAVVLLDINMPRLNGVEVLAEIRRTHPKLPVVLMSGYPHAVEAQSLDGHTLFLQKPFRYTMLRDKVRSLVEG